MKFCAIGIGRMGRRHLRVAKNLGFDIVGAYDSMPESFSTRSRVDVRRGFKLMFAACPLL